jgi:23S rRNA-/tRNA-specific pseudouridylate synthase
MRQAGHLILGDKQYAAGQKTILGKGLFLCATQLSFLHPVTEKPVVLRINPPRRFDKTLDREEERY